MALSQTPLRLWRRQSRPIVSNGDILTASHSRCTQPARTIRGRTLASSTSSLGTADHGVHQAAIALGSNLGDKVGHIENALKEMQRCGLRVLSVSDLYQTKAMYYEDQDSFMNGACHIETILAPLDLLDVLQSIENRSGRVRTIDKGPRTLDLDILTYDESRINCERLEVPHKLIMEREFVLRPLADILPGYKFPSLRDGASSESVSVKSSLQAVADPATPMYPVTTLSASRLLMPDDPRRQTQLMSVLNITPDSFSDGGYLSAENTNKIQETVRKQITSGATILDIGGQSTRPRADFISAKDELQRVLPVVEAIRAMPEARDTVISIDTFHSEVARQAIKAGADIINDVSAGQLDPDMLDTVAELGKTIVLMHMRGNPDTMTQLTDYPEGVLTGVAQELETRVQEARQAGIHPWRIILDPGIGFAKTQKQNLELLRNMAWLRAQPAFRGLPWLLGVSRKGFIGKITSVAEAHQRTWGTAAAITASIAGGSDIVRVHDVEEMRQVAMMADAIYR